MIFKQVFDQKSSTYTYIIASSKGREALIIDPVLENIDEYIKLLNELDLKLLRRILDRKAHWNNAEVGSHINFKRYPNKMDPDVHTCMSFFHL